MAETGGEDEQRDKNGCVKKGWICQKRVMDISEEQKKMEYQEINKERKIINLSFIEQRKLIKECE